MTEGVNYNEKRISNLQLPVNKINYYAESSSLSIKKNLLLQNSAAAEGLSQVALTPPLTQLH